jgi:hypothetical protein
MTDEQKQREVCARFDAAFVAAEPFEKVGLARNVGQGLLPLNGLRHPKGDGTSGWFIWAGEEFSTDVEFFAAVHVTHLDELCPEAIPYLGLAPGWRFLVAPGYEDVWFDDSLLAI